MKIGNSNLLENRFVKTFIILVLLFAISLLLTKPLFQKGFIDGHDNVFHFSQIKELYLSVKKGNGFSAISPTLYNGIGYGARLFYSSLSHTMTVIIGLIIEPFGFDLLVAFKIVIFLSLFCSGIITYLFIFEVSKNHFYSVIAAIIYMAFPYRTVDIFIRNAFAESIAFMFIPGVFWGVYEILNQEKNKSLIKGYFLVIVNTSLLFFTHNLTAIYTVVLVFIYILINIKKVIKIIRINSANKYYIFISTFLILLITSRLTISMLEQRAILEYAVFNSNSMRTTLARIALETERSTAFLLAGTDIYSMKIVELGLSVAIFSIVYLILKLKFIYYQYLLAIIPIVILILSLIMLKVNFFWYQYLSCLVIALVVIYLFTDKSKESDYKYQNITSFTILLVVVLIYLYMASAWKYLPEVLYNIQFPWRLWSFAGLFIAILIPLLIRSIKIKYIYKKTTLLAVATLLIAINYPVNKKVETYFSYQNQAFPTEFLEDKNLGDHTQLYQDVRNYLATIDSYQKVDVLYNGDYHLKAYTPIENAIIKNEKMTPPSYYSEVTTSENTLLLIPFIYFPGFQVSVTNINLSETWEFAPFSYDYFVAFVLQTDALTTFKINVNYYHNSDINNYPKHPNAGGWEREYFPLYFFDNEGFNGRSPLYQKIRQKLDSDAANTIEHKRANYFIYDEDTKFYAESQNENILISNQKIEAPFFNATIKLNNSSDNNQEEAIVQIPFIFYNGYHATVTNARTKEKIAIKLYESDFLVTIKFDVIKGEEYQINLDFKGTTKMQISQIISIVATVITILLPAAACFVYKNKKYCNNNIIII